MIALETDPGQILARFWTPKSIQNRSQETPLKLLKIIAFFGCLLEPQKIDFCANMAATWPDLGPQDGPKLGPKWCQNRSRRLTRPHGAPMDLYGPSPNRFWIDFGTILDRPGQQIHPPMPADSPAQAKDSPAQAS